MPAQAPATRKTSKTDDTRRNGSHNANHNANSMETEQLSTEMTALLEPEQETELLAEEQLVFNMGTSVELYTEVLDESKFDKMQSK